MALSYKNDEEQDERLNPYSGSAHNLQKQENDSLPGYDRKNDGLDDHPITAGDASGVPGDIGGGNNTKNIDNANAKEKEAGGWALKTGNDKDGGKKKGWGTALSPKNLRKKGPLGFLIFAMAGGGGLLSILFSPGIALVQLKEILLDDLNDQAKAMDIRTDHMFRAKLDSIQGGASICTKAVSIRCKFATMSDRQVRAFQRAGFTIDPSTPDKRFGRTKPVSITFPDGTVVTTPTEMRNHIRGNTPALSALRKAFNYKFAGFSDPTSGRVFAGFKTDKTKKVTGGTAEERDKSITAATSGEKAGVGANGFRTDENGRNFVIDENGARIYESGDGSNPSRFKEIADREKASLSAIADAASKATSGAKAVGGVLATGIKGVNIIGPADTACTVYNTARAAAAAAKISRALQLVQFVMIVFVTADRIKAGVATPEEVTHVGDKLTAVDTQETIASDEIAGQEEENPDYGENAFDSAGYAVAAYNAAPLLNARDIQFAIGGGLVGGLSKVMDEVSKVLGGRNNIRHTCKVIQSWWARSAGLIAGVASAIGSFGTSTAISIGASVAIGFAMPFLVAELADIIAGTVVSGSTKGVDMGNASFAGAAALLGGMAMARGMKPGKSSEINSFLSATKQSRDDMIAVETYEAKKTPFDITKQYSFLGSAVRKVNPTLIKSTSSIAGAISSIPAFISLGFSSIIPTANAASEFNPERYERCSNDEGYRELGIDADVFCNVRYVMSNKQLAMDPLVSAQWMLGNGHINEDGSPLSDAYNTWIKNCTQRQSGWGETESDDNVSDADIGKICMEVNEQNDNFAVFTMDKGISEGMDADLSNGGTSSPESAFFYDPALNTKTNVATDSKDTLPKKAHESTTTKSIPAQLSSSIRVLFSAHSTTNKLKPFWFL